MAAAWPCASAGGVRNDFVTPTVNASDSPARQNEIVQRRFMPAMTGIVYDREMNFTVKDLFILSQQFLMRAEPPGGGGWMLRDLTAVTTCRVYLRSG
jgi:hypothetical protein